MPPLTDGAGDTAVELLETDAGAGNSEEADTERELAVADDEDSTGELSCCRVPTTTALVLDDEALFKGDDDDDDNDAEEEEEEEAL